MSLDTWSPAGGTIWGPEESWGSKTFPKELGYDVCVWGGGAVLSQHTTGLALFDFCSVKT